MRVTLNQLETALKRCFDVDSTLCARMRFICWKLSHNTIPVQYANCAD